MKKLDAVTTTESWTKLESLCDRIYEDEINTNAAAGSAASANATVVTTTNAAAGADAFITATAGTTTNSV